MSNPNNHPNRSKLKWLKGLGGTEFLQFQKHRLERDPFPLGGFIYTVRNSPDDGAVLYCGNNYDHARAAIQKANP
jgi:hypothetical protein